MREKIETCAADYGYEFYARTSRHVGLPSKTCCFRRRPLYFNPGVAGPALCASVCCGFPFSPICTRPRPSSWTGVETSPRAAGGSFENSVAAGGICAFLSFFNRRFITCTVPVQYSTGTTSAISNTRYVEWPRVKLKAPVGKSMSRIPRVKYPVVMWLRGQPFPNVTFSGEGYRSSLFIRKTAET